MVAPLEDITALVDRCMLVGMPGTKLPPQFRDWLADGLGGVILFRGNIADAEQLTELCGELHAAGTDLLIAADEEGGDITRLHARDGSPTPGNLALGAIDDVSLTRATARSIGAELVATGVNLNLAPSVDVNTCPDNPIIGTRSFGADPELVARHTVAYLDGLREAGVAGCVKHFPGHGDTSVDSHLDLPAVNGDIEPHLVPFRAAIEAGVDAIMCAHIHYPALDDVPATLSRRILTGLLRERLGWTGPIITDSLTMAAITERVGLAEGCVQALAAGADLLCMNSDYDEERAARDHVVAAVRDGRLPLERVREAADRVRALARAQQPPASIEPGPVWTGELAHRVLYVDLARSLPPGAPYVVEIAPPRAGIEPSAASLLEIMRAHDGSVDGVRLYPGAADTTGADPQAGLASALAAARGRPLILVVKDAHRRPDQRDLVSSARAQRPDAVVVGTGTTADADLAPGHYVGARAGATVNLRAAAELLLGAS